MPKGSRLGCVDLLEIFVNLLKEDCLYGVGIGKISLEMDLELIVPFFW